MTFSLFLEARAAIEAASTVAAILARELGRNPGWEHEQVAGFRSLAKGYVFES